MKPTVYCIPSLAAAAIAGGVSVFIDGWVGGLVVGATVVGGAAMSCFMLNRDWQNAFSRLNNDPSAPGKGTLFDHLVSSAAAIVADYEDRIDVSESDRTELEARLHLAKRGVRRSETTFTSLACPAIVFDESGQVSLANDAAIAIDHGLAQGNEFDVTGPLAPVVGAVNRIRQRAKHQTDSAQQVDLVVGEEPNARSFRVVIRAVRENDALIGVTAVFIDRTDGESIRKQCSQFLGSACHELKTPLTSIRAHAELLADGDLEDPEAQAESLHFIDEQVDRLTRLVNNTLNLARIESGVIKVAREDLELGEVARAALEVVRPAAEEKSISLIDELSDMYLPVHVDRDLFGQGVINLLTNAVKYTPAGGEVTLRTRQAGDNSVVVEVADNGMGIPAESLPKIFTRFYRVPENNAAAAGTGLGLALVQFIIEDLHGGHIHVESEVGVGTRFTFDIPRGHRDRARVKPQQPALAVS